MNSYIEFPNSEGCVGCEIRGSKKGGERVNATLLTLGGPFDSIPKLLGLVSLPMRVRHFSLRRLSQEEKVHITRGYFILKRCLLLIRKRLTIQNQSNKGCSNTQWYKRRA